MNMILEAASTLDNAMLEAREMERLTLRFPDLSLDDAYLIQDEGIKLRSIRGEKQIGLKMGLTSEAKRKQMNLGSPIYGVLTDRMQIQEGSTFLLEGKIHPKIEPEIAFIIGRDLRGKVTREEALAACSGVAAAMEILDSRYIGFNYFSLPDVVADNSSSAFFVLGKIHNFTGDETDSKFDLSKIDLGKLEMSMEVNGEVVQRATSDAISGDPVMSIVLLSELLESRGLTLPAGSIVLAGAATQAVKMEPGMEIRLSVTSLGSVSVRVG